MATLSSVNLVTPRTIANGPDVPTLKVPCLNRPWKRVSPMKLRVGPVRAAPDGISEKVEKSIKEAQEMCSDDPASGDHARDKKKDDDPLENYCKDNPETDECRTYDN
ncbi:hypothetical protein Gotri_007961 [Gossypium trilobum]|uniref:CP12 domain-containing protein n=1 Tax=Gossypium trilobum TaxID=34281 RepID=A0A7J9EHV3_9ROSI|nr:hypothetical protein [Gossypium trilobum]